MVESFRSFMSFESLMILLFATIYYGEPCLSLQENYENSFTTRITSFCQC